MHSEYFGAVLDGQVADVLEVLVQRVEVGRKVDARLRVLVVGVVDALLAEEPRQHGLQAPLVDCVRHPPSVGYFSCYVDERVPRYGVVLVGVRPAEEVEVEVGALPVGIRERVADVPAERSELLALLECLKGYKICTHTSANLMFPNNFLLHTLK